MSSSPTDKSTSGGQSGSELQLGIRELFRVFVPGAYALFLAAMLPGAVIPDSIMSSNPRSVAAALCLGLFAYGLRPHECCWPYSRSFWQGIDDLNAEIGKVGEAAGRDHTAAYKYFLTVGPSSVGARIHYFSSFYYMIVAVSMYSALAAVVELIVPALQLAWAFGSPAAAALAVSFLVAAALSQLWLLVKGAKGRAGERIIEGWFRFVPSSLVVCAVGVALLNLGWSTGVRFFSPMRTSWIAALLLGSFVFAVLGAKQWKSIIGEQVVHVRVSRNEITQILNSEKSK